jgi:two-component system cell cycle response regulator
MKDKIVNHTATTIIDYIAEITEQRDVELLKVSLLKTISELIPSSKLTLYNMIENGIKKLNLLIINESGETRLQVDESEIHPSTFHAISRCFKNKKISRFYNELEMHAIYPLFGARTIVGFLHIHCKKHKINSRIILGFLKIYRNYLSLLTEHRSDALTGLLNRKTFEEEVNKIIKYNSWVSNPLNCIENHRKAPVSDAKTWLGIFDIDHFKHINDTYGHVFGDEILIFISNIIKNTFRTADLLFRYGGEEFVAVVKCNDMADAEALFERLRSSIGSFRFPQVEKVTVSIGVVEVRNQQVATNITGHADQALYYAKQNGRDRVCMYEKLVEQGCISTEYFEGSFELF